MPTYRILDQDGVVVDKDKSPAKIPDEEIIKMYKDMLSGKYISVLMVVSERVKTDDIQVSIMDLIMFDAQRQGRISFYMVIPFFLPSLLPIRSDTHTRSPQAKKA